MYESRVMSHQSFDQNQFFGSGAPPGAQKWKIFTDSESASNSLQNEPSGDSLSQNLTFLILARKQDLICRVKSLGSNESNWKMTFFEIMGHVIPHWKENLTLILNLQKFFIFGHLVALQSRKTRKFSVIWTLAEWLYINFSRNTNQLSNYCFF